MSKVANYTKKRFFGYCIITLFVFISPFIKINNKHLFCLSFVHQKLDLFFVSFGVWELFLMPFLLIMLFLFIFFITTMLGRVWCSWSCPQTIFRTIYKDIIQTKILKLYPNSKNKQNQPKNKPIKKIIGVVIFYSLAVCAASNLMWYFVPPEDFFVYLKNPSEHLILFGIVFFASLFLTFIVTYLDFEFCAIVCPYARIQSAMYDRDTKQVVYDEDRGGIIYKDGVKITERPDIGECVGCNACVLVCPNHIDIRKGVQLECINCLECVDACSKTQARYDRKSLIGWTSLNAVKYKNKIKYFRFRTIAYMVALAVVFAVFLFMANTKDTMLLKINRTSELYHIKHKKVYNSYTFLIGNTDSKDHVFYFDVDVGAGFNLSKDSFKIKRPKDEIFIKANGKVKKIVILSAKDLDVENKEDDVIIPLKVKAYAKDDEGVYVVKDAIFVYPKQEELEKRRK